MMNEWSRSEKIGFLSIAIAIVSIAFGVTNHEVRVFLGLEPKPAIHASVQPSDSNSPSSQTSKPVPVSTTVIVSDPPKRIPKQQPQGDSSKSDSSTTQQDDEPKPIPIPPQASFVISDALAPNQLAETIKIWLDGKYRGLIQVDRNNTVSFLHVNDVSPGFHNYVISATGAFPQPDGSVQQDIREGQGRIDVANSQQYSVTLGS